MQDRHYQLVHIESIVEQVSAKRKVCAFLPTGGGKTVEFSMIAQRFCRRTDKSVLILVHREELLNQAAKATREIMQIQPCLITSETKRFSVSKVYIGMVDSLMSRLDMFHNVGLVIIDECHVANFNKVHSIFLEELIIGFSATPISSSKKDPLNKYYNAIVCGPQIKELIKLGFLAQNITRCPKEIVDATKFAIDKLKGDYNEGQMAAEYKQPKHITNVIKSYNKYCHGKKTIVFNVNIEHSKEVDECFRVCGFNSRHLDSDSSKRPSKDPRCKTEREEIMLWFKETEDAILSSVMIPTTGFDEPTVHNIILNFSTLSIAKFIQCSGRGSRVIDEYFIKKFQKDYPYPLEAKYHFNIIDMGGNCIKFGDWSDERDWQYIFDNPDIPGNGLAPVKTCPDCEGLLHAAKMTCDLPIDEEGNICGHVFTRRKTAEETDMEEMILVTKNVNVDELIKKYKHKYEYYTFLEMGADVVKLMYLQHRFSNLEGDKALFKEIKSKYFDIYYKLCIDWYRKTLANKQGYEKDITNSAWHIKRAKNNFETLLVKLKPQPQNNRKELAVF